MRLTLRPYQTEALQRVNTRRLEGVSRQLGVMATGLGKTVTFAALAEQMACRTLILVHRDELLRGAVAEIMALWPDVPSIGIVKGTDNEVRADIVVASVQTLARPNRLARLCPPYDPFVAPDDEWSTAFAPDPFGLLIIDEAHHAAAASYRRIIDHVGAGVPGGPFLYGTTATPQRADGQGLDKVFSEIAFNYDILWGIRQRYLSDIRGQRVRVTDLDLADVRTSRGDYQSGDSGRALHDAGAPWAIAQAWAEHARGRRTLAFLPTVDTSLETAEAFQQVGARVAHIDGTTDLSERRGIIRRYNAGDLDVITNCMVLTEGFNAPRTDCIVIGRPTKSAGLYTQMVGRGTRRHPEKTDCLVLDVVGASDDLSLVTLPTLFGLPRNFHDRAQDGSVPISDLVTEFEDLEIRAGRLEAEAVDLFRRIREEGLAWITAPRRDVVGLRYVLPLTTDRRLVMVQVDLDDEESWAVQDQVDHVGAQVLLRGADLETCQAVAEDVARKDADLRLLNPNARWRTKTPSPKQLAAARKWHLPDLAKYETAGALSDALTAHIEHRTAHRRRAAGTEATV